MVSAPTREDPLVASLSEVVGGPVGDHAGPHRWWSPLRLQLVLTAAALILGLAVPGASTDPARVAGLAGD